MTAQVRSNEYVTQRAPQFSSVVTAFAMAVVFTTNLAAQPYSSPAAQGRTDISLPEFRQVLVDWGTFIDQHKGTNLRSQFESAPDYALAALYPAGADMKRLQSALTALKTPAAAASANNFTPRVAATPLAQFPNCSAGEIIDDAGGSTCTPSYPSGSAWAAMVVGLGPIGAISNTSSAGSSQRCDTGVESALALSAIVFQGTLNTNEAVCGALISPASNVCWGIAAGVAVANSATQGLFATCVEQDGDINAAQIEAGFHNTVTIFNNLKGVAGQVGTAITNIATLDGKVTTVGTDVKTIDTKVNNLQTSINTAQTAINNVQVSINTLQTSQANNQALNFRLVIENELLQAGSGGIGLLELPASAGGYLEMVRTVVVDTIQKFVAAGQPVGSANAFLALADQAVASANYKTAFTNYRYAYRLAVQ